METSEIILGIILVVGYIVYRIYEYLAFQSYDMSNVSGAQMVRDRLKGKSTREIRRNVVKGKYTKGPKDLF